MKLIIALMTCHNRCEKTIASIQSYFSSNLGEEYERKLVLVDDGSTDGTAEAVRAKFPQVVLEQGDGNLYWNRGMLHAWETALTYKPDFVLWLNDDTVLYPQALRRMLDVDQRMRSDLKRPGITVGSTENEQGELTYGGAVSMSWFNRLKTKKIVPTSKAQPVETMNGNCVLVPREVSDRIGLLDKVFAHAMGDIDYGFRATRAGVPILLAPGFCGKCLIEDRVKGSYKDNSLSLGERWKKVNSTKGLPLANWLIITKRYAGPMWLLVWLWPYLKIAITSLFLYRPRHRRRS